MDKIAVLGPQGTFSDDAAQRFLEQSGRKEDLLPVYYPTIDEAFHMVGKECGWGVIPIENTLDGYVQRTLDLLLEMEVSVIGEITIPVQFSFIANADSVEKLEKLYVQFKASGQRVIWSPIINRKRGFPAKELLFRPICFLLPRLSVK